MTKGLSQVDQGEYNAGVITIDSAGPSDTTPDPFGWPAQSGWGTSQTATSTETLPTGYNAPTLVSTDIGEFSVNGDVFSSTPRNISPGQHLTARHTTNASAGQSVTQTMTIGGVDGTFITSTQAASTGDWKLGAQYRSPARVTMTPVYPRGDGATNSNARHRWMHSQMEYQVPIGVRGGEYPYKYELLSPSPAGATIGEEMDIDGEGVHTPGEWYGVVRYTPLPGDTTVSFKVRVTDQADHIIELDWSASKSDSKFTFIQDGVSSGSGSISSPLEDWDDWYKGDRFDQSFRDQIIVFRAGNYTMEGDPTWSDGNYPNLSVMDNKTRSLMAFPGELATIDCGNSSIGYLANGSDMFLGGLKFTNGQAAMSNTKFLWLATPSRPHRTTIWNNHFDDLASGTKGASNTCAVWLDDIGTLVENFFYTMNLHTNFNNKTGPTGNNGSFLDMYSNVDTLVERNTATGAIRTTYAFWLKSCRSGMTFRGNIIDQADMDVQSICELNYGTTGGLGVPANDVEVCYNRFVGRLNPGGNLFKMKNSPTYTNYTNWSCYRNTFVGQKDELANPPDLPERFDVDSNVIISDHSDTFNGSPPRWDPAKMYNYNDLTGDDADNIVDGEGRLTGSSRTNNLGEKGAEIYGGTP